MANSAFKILPKNYLESWGEFESWAYGAGSAPDGWVIASSPTIAQETSNINFGNNSVSITGAGGLFTTIPDSTSYRGRTFTFGCYAMSSSTAPYIKLSDGVAEVTYHLDGSGAFAEVTTPHMKLDWNNAYLRVDLFCPTGVQAYFDSAVLCQGEDLFTNLSNGDTAISGWTPALALKQDEFDISQNQGTFIPETRLSTRNIRLQGSIVGSDAISARDNFDNLMKSILAWDEKEKRNVYLYNDRVSEVFLKSLNWNYVRTLSYINFTMVMSNPSSVTRSIGRYRNRAVISSTVSEFSFNYGGTAESKPIISFIASQGQTISTCFLQNLTTGQGIIYSGTVPSGVALNIDCSEGTVLNSSVSDLVNFGTSDFLKLVRGTNYFRFSGQNCEINIDYFERFI